MHHCFIIIDCWSTTDTRVALSICQRITSNPHALIIHANYGGDHGDAATHPYLVDILATCPNPVYHRGDNITWLTRTLQTHQIQRVFIMGSSWPACTHHSTFGIFALQQLQAEGADFEIAVWPECVALYDPAQGAVLNSQILVGDGWTTPDYYSPSK